MTEIEYNGKKYNFSAYSIILFWVFAPIIAILVYKATGWGWLYTFRPVVAQTTAVINFFTHMGLTWQLVSDSLGNPLYYQFIVPGQSSIQFETMCTGVQAIAIFAGIIIMIPHSKDKVANKRIWTRKLFALVVSSAIFYVVNIIRMLIQLTLYYHGYPWDEIHVSISAASSFIAAIIIILMHRWIPEFIISIIWTFSELRNLLFGKKTTSKKQDIAPSLQEKNVTETPNEEIKSSERNV